MWRAGYTYKDRWTNLKAIVVLYNKDGTRISKCITDEHIKHNILLRGRLGQKRLFELKTFGLVKSQRKNVPLFLAQGE